MIKIAFVIDTIESPTGGTEKQLIMLIRNLDRTKFKPFLCVLRSSGWLDSEFDLCPFFIADIPSFKSPTALKGIFNLAKHLKTNEINIVQCHFRDSNIAGIMAAKLAGIQTIVGTRRNQGYWYTPLELLIIKIQNNWVNWFLANCESTKQWAAKSEGINPERIGVIHNSLEIERYSRAPEDKRRDFRNNLGFPSNVLIVGIVANLRPVKALDVYIKASAIVATSCPNTRFIVVGEGPEKEQLEALCNDLGIANLVRFLGKRLDVPEILGCIDVGVLSSNSESFSNAIVEYMAAGLPVVCTDVGGAREAVEDHVNGFVIQPGNCQTMADMISDIICSGRIMLLGENSRKKAETFFSLPMIMQRYEQFYAKAVNGQ